MRLGKSAENPCNYWLFGTFCGIMQSSGIKENNMTQLNLFNEAEVEAKAGAREPQLQETEVKAHRRKKQKGHKDAGRI